MDVYMFQAALYCEDCGRAIAEALDARGVGDEGDADAYPQGPYPDGGGEADSPQHCDAGAGCLNAEVLDGRLVGVFLENPLTDEGRRYVAAGAERPQPVASHARETSQMKGGGARHVVPPAQHGQHWVTLSNKRRVLLDDEGRIRRGLPAMFSNVHVQDVSELHRRAQDIEDGAQECEAEHSGRGGARTFRTTEDGVRALLRSNPGLVDFLEQECSHDCDRYRTWVRRGRRGSKPRWRAGDGRFDALQVGLDLKGARKISSWLEAVYVTIPPSRRWSDFAARLQYLVDATGLSLMLPEEAEELVGRRDELERCQQVADERIEELILLARSVRLTGAAADSDVPF